MAKKMFTILTTALITCLSTIGIAQAPNRQEIENIAALDVNDDGREDIVARTDDDSAYKSNTS